MEHYFLLREGEMSLIKLRRVLFCFVLLREGGHLGGCQLSASLLKLRIEQEKKVDASMRNYFLYPACHLRTLLGDKAAEKLNLCLPTS